MTRLTKAIFLVFLGLIVVSVFISRSGRLVSGSECKDFPFKDFTELTKMAKEDCEKCGGQWEHLNMAGVGCNPKTADGGKKCGDTKDCQGACLDAGDQSDFGICSSYRFNLGCHKTLISGVKVMVCTD